MTALLKGLEGDIDCIVLSEAHITDKRNINQYSFDGYSAYSSQYNVRKTDGLAIYVKSSLEHSIEEIKIKDANCINVKIVKDKKVFCYTTIYRSPQGTIITKFLTDLSSILETRNQDNAIKILTGDVNINLLDKKSEKVQNYLNILSESVYMSLINKPTRVGKKPTKKGKKIMSCIDHIFVGPEVDDSMKSFILQNITSDHYSTLLSIDMEKGNELKETEYFSLKEIKEDKLLREIEKENWEVVYSCEDPNICTDIFVNKIRKLIDRCSERKIKKVQKKKNVG